MTAKKTLVWQVLLGPGECAFFRIAGQLAYRPVENTAYMPFGFDEEIAAKGFARMLDHDIAAALPLECANRVLTGCAV